MTDVLSPQHDFRHALLDNVAIGTRHAIVLFVRPLIWSGSSGEYGRAMRIRFGKIRAFSEVSTFFALSSHCQGELADLRWVRSTGSSLLVDVEFERIDARLNFQCGHVDIGDATTE